MRLTVFGADKPATRAVVDWLFEYGGIDALLILTKTGLASYAWDRAQDFGKHRAQYWLDRLSLGADAMAVAVHQLVTDGKPDVALCISPRQHDERIVGLLKSKGCTVIYGRLDAAKNVAWCTA